MAAQVGSLGPQAGRGAIHALRAPARALLVDDSYNSNPDALARALEAAAALPGARHWAVVGDMLELGSAEVAHHRDAGVHAAAAGMELLVGVGTLARGLLEAARERGVQTEWFADAAAAAPWCLEALRDDDVVLVKGSRGVRLERVVSALLEAGRDGGAC
jgi:UDP-N-acetylmuramoyl-tripeptide--D-alanyl-D-alanine ligase